LPEKGRKETERGTASAAPLSVQNQTKRQIPWQNPGKIAWQMTLQASFLSAANMPTTIIAAALAKPDSLAAAIAKYAEDFTRKQFSAIRKPSASITSAGSMQSTRRQPRQENQHWHRAMQRDIQGY
jgi:hypothetical protein